MCLSYLTDFSQLCTVELRDTEFIRSKGISYLGIFVLWDKTDATCRYATKCILEEPMSGRTFDFVFRILKTR